MYFLKYISSSMTDVKNKTCFDLIRILSFFSLKTDEKYVQGGPSFNRDTSSGGRSDKKFHTIVGHQMLHFRSTGMLKYLRGCLTWTDET